MNTPVQNQESALDIVWTGALFYLTFLNSELNFLLIL